jgi:hypothetical protein
MFSFLSNYVTKLCIGTAVFVLETSTVSVSRKEMVIYVDWTKLVQNQMRLVSFELPWELVTPYLSVTKER